MNLEVYLIHCKKLKDRKVFMEKQFLQYGFNDINWITILDADELTKEDIKCLYLDDSDEWNKKCFWISQSPYRKLSKNEISCAMKHIEAYKMFEKTKKDYALLLEDDVIFDDDFNDKFENIFQDYPKDFDFIFMGNGCNLRIKDITDKKFFYRKENPAAKCTDSYIISKKCLNTLIDGLRTITVPIDFELNNIIKNNNLIVYWVEPPLFTQGSQNGKFKRSI